MYKYVQIYSLGTSMGGALDECECNMAENSMKIHYNTKYAG